MHDLYEKLIEKEASIVNGDRTVRRFDRFVNQVEHALKPVWNVVFVQSIYSC